MNWEKWYGLTETLENVRKLNSKHVDGRKLELSSDILALEIIVFIDALIMYNAQHSGDGTRFAVINKMLIFYTFTSVRKMVAFKTPWFLNKFFTIRFIFEINFQIKHTQLSKLKILFLSYF